MLKKLDRKGLERLCVKALKKNENNKILIGENGAVLLTLQRQFASLRQIIKTQIKDVIQN